MLAFFALLVACAQEPPGSDPAAEPPASASTPVEGSVDLAVYDVRVLRAFPHDEQAFTQGLFFVGGALHESTGQLGQSVIRRLDLRDGSAVREVSLPEDVFGEGATVVGDEIVSVTWRAGRGFVHDAESFERTGTFAIEGEGWGLAYDWDRDRLLLSDGTSILRILEPDTYEEIGQLPVTLNGRPLPRLNELEYVPENGGEVWANVWQQDFVVRIDAQTGEVTGVIDVSTLFPAQRRTDPRDDVPNGIAYEPRSGRIFLTGKRWPRLFEVELSERERG